MRQHVPCAFGTFSAPGLDSATSPRSPGREPALSAEAERWRRLGTARVPFAPPRPVSQLSLPPPPSPGRQPTRSFPASRPAPGTPRTAPTARNRVHGVAVLCEVRASAQGPAEGLLCLLIRSLEAQLGSFVSFY